MRDVPRIVPPRWIRPRVRGERQLDRVVVEDAAPAVTEAQDLMTVETVALADHGADDRVETRAVASARQHTDAHGDLLLGFGSMLPAARRSRA